MIHSKQIRTISNSFYNDGLFRAKKRDLTGAAESLRKCLNLNKYHTQARNLLGLIFYEMGEVSEALVQWVISTNLDKSEANLAHRYIDLIQENQRRLDAVGKDIQKFNEALIQAQSGNADLAVLQLNGVVERQPHFLKAQLLLGLLLLERHELHRAGKVLNNVLEIDRGSRKAEWYLAALRQETGLEEAERRRMHHAFSHRTMTDDDVIIPPSYRENTGWQSILNIAAGLLLGAAAVFFLIMPARIKQNTEAHNQELVSYNEQLNQKNEEIDSLNSQMDSYKADKESAEQQLNTLQNDSGSIMAQYTILVQLENYLRSGDMNSAAMIYANFNPEIFTDETVKNIANSVRQEIATKGYQTIENQAYEEWNSGHYDQALSLYQTCLNVKPQNPKVMYYMAMIYRAQGNTDQAVAMLTQVVTQYPDSSQAGAARTQLSAISPEAAQAAENPSAAAESSAAENPSAVAETQG
ncbi:tetratricopeptide repeat protein [Clostridium vitabionis]|uniref:tetratricopeptide repeat protein n=1 Tax=Clostridium vitabionis TaxID=2784388 RepID=UPI00188CB32A|nr:tetratricopeptide repeat protein [Clostridium vitabionis]